jgi:pyrroloquinoline quinone biosynthesis protein B
MRRLSVIVLGSAAGGGFPQWNCACDVCSLAWNGDARVKPRTQASLAVTIGPLHNGQLPRVSPSETLPSPVAGSEVNSPEAATLGAVTTVEATDLDGGEPKFVLINASPDLRAQILATPALRPRRLRDSPIAAVVLTGAEVDQTAGLLTLRERGPFSLFGTETTLKTLADNSIFDVLAPGAVMRKVIRPGISFRLPNDIEAELFLVPGKAPLYLEGENPQLAEETEANVGIELRAEGARLVFIPGAANLTEPIVERLRDADAVLFDGTLFDDDEMIASGTGTKTGRRMGHMPVGGPGGSLAALAGLGRRRILIHINNTNPILIEGSPQRRAVEAAGFEVAEDGMRIEL